MTDESHPSTISVNERIQLSPMTSADRGDMLELLNEREIYERTFRIPFPYREADYDEFIASMAETARKNGGPLHFAIRDAAGKAIGGCGFEGLARGHRVEVGYWLGKPYWGRGIVTSVVAAMCEFAFREWDLVRIIAHVFDFNAASARVLEKNGFEFEGLLRKHLKKEGRFLDCKLYAKLR